MIFIREMNDQIITSIHEIESESLLSLMAIIKRVIDMLNFFEITSF